MCVEKIICSSLSLISFALLANNKVKRLSTLFFLKMLRLLIEFEIVFNASMSVAISILCLSSVGSLILRVIVNFSSYTLIEVPFLFTVRESGKGYTIITILSLLDVVDKLTQMHYMNIKLQLACKIL